MVATLDAHAFLSSLGQRVRRLRHERGLTARAVAERAGISLRFYSELEAGRANIAISRLAGVAHALSVPLTSLLAEDVGHGSERQRIARLLDGCSTADLARCVRAVETAVGAGRPVVLALLGLRGAGKTTIGSRLARGLGVPFVEVDELIEQAAGLGLAEVFNLHGERYHRRLARTCLATLIARDEPLVAALPGGIVHDAEAYEMVRTRCVTAWLKARPEEHFDRVVAQGDRRPMAGRKDAMAELREILREREPLYARADVVLDTSRRDEESVTEQLATVWRERILAPA